MRNKNTSEIAYITDDIRDPRLLDPNLPVWIFGAGGFAKGMFSALISKGFDVAGFLQTKPDIETLLDRPVRSLTEASLDRTAVQVAIGIFNRETAFPDLVSLAEAAGYKNIFIPPEFYPQLQAELGWKYWMSTRDEIISILPKLQTAFDLFEDEQSRDRFTRILKFRLGTDPAYGSFRDEDVQYFNRLTAPFLRKEKGIVYVDGGAFDGDSHRDLAKASNVSEAFLFEPDPANYSLLVHNTRQSASGITHCLPIALSDGYKTLSFGGGTGESSAISDSGGQTIVTAALDSLFPNRTIDFLKLDIEGAEAAAIEGATEILQRSQPVVAISLYHKVGDLADLPILLKRILPNHSLHIIQHMYNSFESVLYAVPSAKLGA
ncbi:FkbM family methyltransferase [Rhizobium sp. SAFR-030]|uniref:FkbM family methyltransferase n=1 Tax=Rhizobium sp. SAFR-030 TaxID=3387277 RepID=UPI003F8226EF